MSRSLWWASGLSRRMVNSRTILVLIGALFGARMRASDTARQDRVQVLPVVDKQDIPFTRLSIGGELFTKWVIAIAQDKFGFIWLGTDEGLYRYDGYTIEPFTHDPDDPGSLSDNTIKAIYSDRDGILWIGTGYGGLDRLDPAQFNITHYRHDDKNGRSLSADTVTDIFRDRAGVLWVGTDHGLNRMDGDGVFSHFLLPQGHPNSNVVTTLYEDRHDDFFVGAAEGLNRLDRRTGRFLRIIDNPAVSYVPERNYVGAMWEDRSGVLWVTSPMGNGLSALNAKTGELQHFALNSDRSENSRPRGIHKVYEDRSGSLWLGTWADGLLKFDQERKHFLRYSTDPNRLIPGDAQVLFEDAEGNLWVGTKTGVIRFQTRQRPFSNYRHETGHPDSLRSNEIFSVLADAHGFLWVGTSEGLHRLDRKSGKADIYQHNTSDPHSLSSNQVTAIIEDRANGLWIGTSGGGLNHFDRASGRFIAYRHDPKDLQSLSSNMIESLFLDRDGILWVGTHDGLNRFAPLTGHARSYRKDARSPSGLADDNVVNVIGDRSGALWIGTVKGLYHFDRSSEQFVDYLHAQGDPANLKRSIITALYEDRRGFLWIGTRNGLNRLDQSNGTVATFTTKDGLANNAIEAIQEDTQENLWLATHEGLSEFSPLNKTVRNYSESDGLPGDFANPGGTSRSCQTPKGEIVFGSQYGITVFNPDRVSTNAYVPPVVLTNFLLSNHPVVPSGDSPLLQPIWATNALALEHWQNQFTIEFASLSYVAPTRNRYRYKLEGFEKGWNEVGADRRIATYTNLAPAKYVFRVQGSNDDLLWNETGVSLEITALPPLWGTWWFRSIAFLGAASLAFTAYRLRIRSLRLAAHRLELQVDQRTRELRLARDAADSANRAKSAFLANMSHELRTPLNSILGFSTLLREGKASKEQQQKDLETINRSGHHLLGLINNVLDLAKVESGRTELHLEPCDLKNLVTEITEMIRVRASEKNVALRVVETPDSPRAVRTDGEKLRQVLINLLGNAVKFTEKGNVTLTVNSRAAEDGQGLVLIFEVEDTGIGIAADDQARIFDAFAQAGKPTTNKGTGLGLTISRQFVKLMGGSIEVASTPGRGSRFRVELPADPIKEPELRQPETEECKIIGVELDRPDYRVLIVEDGEENRLVLQRLMESAGFQVRCGENGAQGVEMFQNWRPDFIWMDLRMPLMDGKEAARRIRDLDGGRNAKIAAVTASAFASERDDVMAAGVDDFIRKPYQSSEIFDCMARHLGLRRVFLRSPKEQRRVPLSKEGLEALPRELVGELRSEIVRLDNKRIQGVIARISQYDPAIGQQLTHMAASFAYTAMLEAVQPEDDKSAGGSTVERT